MTTFEDLLRAARNLNDPTSGVTTDWKNHLRDDYNHVPIINTNLESLSEEDGVFNKELQSFITNTAPDNATIVKLIKLIEGYLVKTRELYNSLLNVKYSKASDKKTAENVKAAYDNLQNTLKESKESLASWESPAPTTNLQTIAFEGVIGSLNPPAQVLTIKNVGGTFLSWGAEGIDDIPWLMVSPVAGGIKPGESVAVKVAAIFPNSPLTCGPQNFDMNIGFGYHDEWDFQAREHHSQRLDIPVTFEVYQPCTISGSASQDLNFAIAKAQTTSSTLTIKAEGAGDCILKQELQWSAISTASWLTFDPKTPSTGSVSSGSSTPITIIVDSSNLDEGTYTGAIILMAVDSIDSQPVSITGQQGTSQIIAATLAVKPPCSLGLPSPSCLNFTEVGASPAPQSFTIGIDGDCTYPITITANTDQNWLQVAPSKQTIVGTDKRTITVSIASAQLLPGSYSGSITLNALDKSNQPIGSQQIVEVSLNVVAVPILSISPTSLPKFYIITNQASSSQPIKISNIGSGTMNWKAKLDYDAPDFITLSANQGSLKGGYTDSININFNTNGVKSGTTATTTVTISATDSSGKPVGSPASLPVNVFVTENLFLCVMDQLFQTDPQFINQTEALFDNEELTLNDDAINKLTDSWQAVVNSVVNQTGPCSCLSTPQSDLIVLNEQLEKLYNKIESYVTSK
jgi:hypothetical protein